VLLEIFGKDGVLLKLGDVAEGDEEICRLCNTLIPKLSHGRPVAAHTARSIDESSDHLTLLGSRRLHLWHPE
jgi:hypothetical protein